MNAARSHTWGDAELPLGDGVDAARADLAALSTAGIDLDAITEQLERDGVRQFSEASEKMIEAIGAKRQRVRV